MGAVLITLFIGILTYKKQPSCADYQIGLIDPDQVISIQKYATGINELQNDSISIEINSFANVILLSNEFSNKLHNGTIPWKYVFDSLDGTNAENTKVLLTNEVCSKLEKVDPEENLIVITFCGANSYDVLQIDGSLLEIKSSDTIKKDTKPERNYGNQKVAQLVH